MNILIENAETRGYLASNGEWTKHAADGRDFGATQTAFDAATRAPIGRFNIVCYFPQKTRFIIIPMHQGTGMGAGTGPLQGAPRLIAQPGRGGSSLGRALAA